MAVANKLRIFISYRHDGGEYLSRYINEKMIKRGHRVFYDRESIVTGKFNTQLYDNIASSDIILVILPPNALDRCQNDGDWLRLEIAHAISLEKCIIPIMMEEFKFTDGLPEDIAALSSYQAMRWSMEYWDASLARLNKMIRQAKAQVSIQPNDTIAVSDPSLDIKGPAKEEFIEKHDTMEKTDITPVPEIIDESSQDIDEHYGEQNQGSDKTNQAVMVAGTVTATAGVAGAALAATVFIPGVGLVAGIGTGLAAIYTGYRKRKKNRSAENESTEEVPTPICIEETESE